jgi:hypothetical protein
MSDRGQDVTELLETAKRRVLKATAVNARAARANLAAVLRKAGAQSGLLTPRLAQRTFAASSFLRELAWMSDPVEPSLFARQQADFVTAMDQLVFEVSVAELRPSTPMPVPNHAIAIPACSKQRVVQSRSSLAARLSRWLSGRSEKPHRVKTRKPVVAGDTSAARV